MNNDRNPRGLLRPRDGRGRIRRNGYARGFSRNMGWGRGRNDGPCRFGGPGYGNGNGRGMGRGRLG